MKRPRDGDVVDERYTRYAIFAWLVMAVAAAGIAVAVWI